MSPNPLAGLRPESPYQLRKMDQGFQTRCDIGTNSHSSYLRTIISEHKIARAFPGFHCFKGLEFSFHVPYVLSIENTNCSQMGPSLSTSESVKFSMLLRNVKIYENKIHFFLF